MLDQSFYEIHYSGVTLKLTSDDELIKFAKTLPNIHCHTITFNDGENHFFSNFRLINSTNQILAIGNKFNFLRLLQDTKLDGSYKIEPFYKN